MKGLIQNRQTILCQHQKFHKAQAVAQNLSSLAFKVGMTEFEKRLLLVCDSWANGGEDIIEAVASVKMGTQHLKGY